MAAVKNNLHFATSVFSAQGRPSADCVQNSHKLRVHGPDQNIALPTVECDRLMGRSGH